LSKTLWIECDVATMSTQSDYGLITDASIVTNGATIEWVGARHQVPANLLDTCAHTQRLGGALLTPGLIDCHTHLVYGGDRALEFEQRLTGATYEQIALAGGGIVSTVNATRSASHEQLYAQSAKRLKELIAQGVTTLEIKSGYGLNLEDEQKTLEVARALGASNPVDVITTFLGAHAVPPEFKGQADAYIEAVLKMLPVLHGLGLVDAVDAFCERIGFSIAQTTRVFEAAKSLGLPIKLHAEQLSDSGGAQLAAQFGALSCDHLEWLSEEGAQAMQKAGSVAVLLPAAFYFLRETKVPPIDLLHKYQVPIALSTDCNPGSSPCTSLLLVLNLACTLFRLTPAQALAGVTRNAAKALGLHDRGEICVGKRADFAVWDVSSPAQLSYAIGANPRISTVYKGQLL
jgi:imidazolonepropionase